MSYNGKSGPGTAGPNGDKRVEKKILIKLVVIVFAVLACATFFSHAFVDQYEVRGADLLTNGWTVKSGKHGIADITGTSMTLTSAYAGGRVRVFQDVPGAVPGMVVRLSADLKSNDVRPGKKGWHRPRLLLVQNDGKKNRWDLPHQVAAFNKNHEWERYDKVFNIAPETRTVRVTAQVSEAAGVFYLKNISLVPVEKAGGFIGVKKIMLTAWTVFFMLLVGGCMYQGRSSLTGRVLLAVSAVAIIVCTTMPAEMKIRVTHNIQTQVNEQSDTLKAAVPLDITKVGHFAFFGLFGLILGVMMRGRSAGEKMLFILLLAGSTEMAQFYIEGRSPLLIDFFIDLAGGFTGIFSVFRPSGVTKEDL